MSPASSPSPRTMKRLWEWQPPPFTTSVDATAVAAVAKEEEEGGAVRTPQRSALRPEPGRRWVGPTAASEESASLRSPTAKSPQGQQQQRGWVGSDVPSSTISPRVLSTRCVCVAMGMGELFDPFFHRPLSRRRESK
jgi:hypothetical protein